MSLRVTSASRFLTSPPAFVNAGGKARFSVNIQPLKDVNLSQRKIHVVNSKLASCLPKTLTCVPTDADWDAPSKIVVHPVTPQQFSPTTEKVHYYFGGLPALMAAARKLEEAPPGSKFKVIYINDGKIPKTIQSGHQAHVHPSEWSTKDCSTFNLFKIFFQGTGIIKPAPPEDLFNYSYLHFPVKETLDKPLELARLYAKFFRHRLVLDLTSKGGISDDDRWLCDKTRGSLRFHERLSKKIEDQYGVRTFARSFRIYWSPNQTAMIKKKEAWEKLGIQCEWMKPEEMMQRTLLSERVNLYPLKILGDGKFFHHTPDFIRRYLRRTYPDSFSNYTAQASKIYTNAEDGTPLGIEETLPDGEVRIKPVTTFFGSPGHDQVFRLNPEDQSLTKLWKEIPVSGTSSLWSCSIGRMELCKRFGQEDIDDAILHTMVKEIVSSANLSNLHCTVWDSKIDKKNVRIYVRITQGANFNTNVADPNDLINVAENLNQYFDGHWEPISVGTCTRKTLVSNVPERLGGFGEESGFGVGYSGMGYSASGMRVQEMNPPSQNMTVTKIIRTMLRNKWSS